MAHPRFAQILVELQEIHNAKNNDYGGAEKPLANLMEAEKIGIPAWKAVMVRMSDKWSRLQTFAQGGEMKVNSEKITDTLNDLANYAILCRILIEEHGDRS